MTAIDLLGESWAALRANRTRTFLTVLGVTVGALALVLILSLSLGLSRVVDELVAGEQQLRQVFVAPGFGGRLKRGEIPNVTGNMSEEKRARLRRALGKRRRGGPPMQLPTVLLDEKTERELSEMPGVEAAQPFIQERFELALVSEGAAGSEPRRALALGVPADHSYYPERIIAGHWFASNDERGVVVHELALYQMGFVDDASQAALVGRTVRLSAARGSSTARLMQMMMGDNAPARGEPLYVEELPILGVVRERYGSDRSSIVEEGWAMQTDLFLPRDLARELWNRRPGQPGLGAMLLLADTLEDVESIEDAARERGLQARSVRAVVARVKGSLQAATVVAGFLAGIAIFVSALGIVNTMVMSVMERTREIGLLKALGARSRDVAVLFLTEGGLIGLAGGSIGLGLAVVLGSIGNEVGRERIETAFLLPFKGTLFPFPLWLIAGGVGFAVVASLLASVIPALRAARVDPVQALRHE